MLLEKVSLADTHSFSSFFIDYLRQHPSLQPFYSRFPIPANFKAQILEKSSFPEGNRQTLVKVLQKQYAQLDHPHEVKSNIASLASNSTFTITTGHQLNIFTGPLYFIYKIITVINVCRRLREAHPDFHFVPVYWMASEDHDFEEISYFNLYGKKYTWPTDQKGAVGRFNLAGLDALMKEVPGEIEIFRKAYGKHKTLSDAVRDYVNALFGNEGLVVVDADDHLLKSEFKDVIRDDLFDHTTQSEVEASSAALDSAGFKPAVHARSVNFFYLDNGIRARIEKNGHRFSVVDTSTSFSSEEVEKMIDQEPEKFSPNVILRPLYQEIILPNLAYAGGPAEVVYWLQLKNVFQRHKVPFPMLMPRNFALVMDGPTKRKFQKTGLAASDLFEEKHMLFNRWVTRNADHDLSLAGAIGSVREIFEAIKIRAAAIDKTLDPLVSAETKKTLDRLEKIESKLLKAERRRHADKLRQIEAIKDTLFPNNGLQERTDNFLCFYQQDPGFIRKLIEYFDPFDFQFNILSYDD